MPLGHWNKLCTNTTIHTSRLVCWGTICTVRFKSTETVTPIVWSSSYNIPLCIDWIKCHILMFPSRKLWPEAVWAKLEDVNIIAGRHLSPLPASSCLWPSGVPWNWKICFSRWTVLEHVCLVDCCHCDRSLDCKSSEYCLKQDSLLHWWCPVSLI